MNPGVVKMPYDGVLWEVYTEEGHLSPNQPVVKIYRPQEMKLSASGLIGGCGRIDPGLRRKSFTPTARRGRPRWVLSRKLRERDVLHRPGGNRCTVELKPAALPEHVGAGQTADVSFP